MRLLLVVLGVLLLTVGTASAQRTTPTPVAFAPSEPHICPISNVVLGPQTAPPFALANGAVITPFRGGGVLDINGSLYILPPLIICQKS